MKKITIYILINKKNEPIYKDATCDLARHVYKHKLIFDYLDPYVAWNATQDDNFRDKLPLFSNLIIDQKFCSQSLTQVVHL